MNNGTYDLSWVIKRNIRSARQQNSRAGMRAYERQVGGTDITFGYCGAQQVELTGQDLGVGTIIGTVALVLMGRRNRRLSRPSPVRATVLRS